MFHSNYTPLFNINDHVGLTYGPEKIQCNKIFIINMLFITNISLYGTRQCIELPVKNILQLSREKNATKYK